MPIGKDGSYHLNTQRLMAHEKKSPALPKKPMHGGGEEMGGGDGMEHEGGGVEHSQLHPHGDGSYHTVTSDGAKTEHPHITHALAHLAGHHEPKHMHTAAQHHMEGTHMASHHDGMETSGPHDHENLESLKGSMDQFLNEEQKEYT